MRGGESGREKRGEVCVLILGEVPSRSFRRVGRAGSPVVGEAFLELLAGEEDAALYGAQRQVHLLGDLVVFVAGHVHRERNAVFLRELVDGRGDLGGGVGAVGRLKAAVLRQVQVVAVLGLVYHRGRTGYTAVVVDEDVAHYGEHPPFEVGVVNVLLAVVKRLQGRVLKKIVCVVAVRCQHVGEVEKIGLKAHQTVLKSSCFHNDGYFG